jgi:hypothetical protein
MHVSPPSRPRSPRRPAHERHHLLVVVAAAVAADGAGTNGGEVVPEREQKKCVLVGGRAEHAKCRGRRSEGAGQKQFSSLAQREKKQGTGHTGFELASLFRSLARSYVRV